MELICAAPPCRKQEQRSWAAQVCGRFAPLFLTAPPLPPSCDRSPAKNSPLRMPGERFPEHIKARCVKNQA